MQYLWIIGSIAWLLTGCVNHQGANDPYRNTKQAAGVGAALGATTGAIIGYQDGRGSGALQGAIIGGAAGGLIGAGVGRYMDQQQAEFERQLAAERRAHQVEIQRLKNQSLKITMTNEVSFDFNSAAIKPAFHRTLDKVADILKRYKRSVVRITGHTDNIGSSAYNLRLSQRRADAVAWYLEDRGVEPTRIASEGRGETEPRASNNTEAGRQLNRRVDILIVPYPGIQ